MTSAAIVIQAIVDDPTLLAEAEVTTLLGTSAEIIHAFRWQIRHYNAHIHVMRSQTHILACNEAIHAIVQSLAILAEGNYIGKTADCPSRKLMRGLKWICRNGAWPDMWQETRGGFAQYDRSCNILQGS